MLVVKQYFFIKYLVNSLVEHESKDVKLGKYLIFGFDEVFVYIKVIKIKEEVGFLFLWEIILDC